MPHDHVNVLISAAGRRNYLVQWFREAHRALGLSGRVVATDADPTAPGLVPADLSVVVPPFTSDEYVPTLEQLLDTHEIDLVFSLNDYEISQWARRAPRARRRDVVVVGAPPAAQSALEDKLAYDALLAAHGVPTPRTVSARQALDGEAPSGPVVVKNRFGSGSAGLARTTDDHLGRVLDETWTTARHPDGTPAASRDEALDLVVVQPLLDGHEVGLDVVNDLSGEHAGVLARRKIAMRGGETDKAVTLDADPYRQVARAVSAAVGHTGLIDVDLIESDQGPVVIDVNPRFGGGYPFSHVAGADVPRCYLAWATGRPVDPDWLTAGPGTSGAKFDSVAIVGGRTTDA